MKKIMIYLITLMVFTSCEERDVNTISVGIDVQSFFNQENVKILIDNKEIINKQLETNGILGLCLDGRANIKLSEGNHVIKILINDLTTKTETFTLSSNFYIGVNYSAQTKAISLIYSVDPFMYD
jgi:hypothetical protein